MKRNSRILSLLLVSSMLLAACSQAASGGEDDVTTGGSSNDTTIQEVDTTTAPEDTTTAQEDTTAPETTAATTTATTTATSTSTSTKDTRFDKITDTAVREAVIKLYDFFDADALTEWFGSLYDPESGGFYYALSSRDYEGFLADMESTYQICNMIGRGMLGNKSLKEFFGEEITAKMIAFYQGMQDEATGYFIHPQFGYEETMKHVMRYSRDLDWSVSMLSRLGSAPLYALPYERAVSTSGVYATKIGLNVMPLAATAKSTAAVNAEGWEANEESVRAYVTNLLDTKSFESWSNTLSTQSTAFKTAGVLGYVLDVLDERINPELGVWATSKNDDGSYINFLGNKEVAYGVYTGTYKIMILYNNAGRPVPYALQMMENAIDCINSKEPGIRVTYLYNPWATLNCLRTNLKSYGATKDYNTFTAAMAENAVEMIESTMVNLGDFRRDDGSFSFVPGKSSSEIYGTYVSLGYDEGDVNGTLIGVSGMSNSITSALGYGSIDLFTTENGERLLEIMKNAQPIVKKEVPSDQFSYDMESTTIPVGITSQISGILSMVDDPSGADNTVLRLFKDTEKDATNYTGNVQLATNLKMSEGDVIRVSMRVYVSSDTRFGNECSNKNNVNVMQIRFNTKAGNLYMPVIAFNQKEQPSGFYLKEAKSTKGGYTDYPVGQKVFSFDTWYTFDFDFYVSDLLSDNKGFRVVISVDGEKMGESTTFYSDTDYDRADGGTVLFSQEDFNVALQAQMRIHADMYFDDITTEIVRVEG